MPSLEKLLSKSAAALLFIAALVFFSSCGQSEEELFRIGYIGGPSGMRTVELAVEQINQAGGVNGRTVTLTVAESTSASSDEDFIEEINGIVDRGVTAFVGPSTSHMTRIVATGVAAPRQVPFLSHASTDPEVRYVEDDDFVFRMALPDDVQGRALADLVSEEGFSKISIIYRDDGSYGPGFEKTFREAYEAKPGHSVAVSLPHPTYHDGATEDDLLGAVSSGTFDPDGDVKAFLVISSVDEAKILMKELLRNDEFEKYYFTDSLKAVSLLNELNEYINEQGLPDRLEGSKGMSPPDLPDDIVAAYEEKFPEADSPLGTPFLSEAYDATVAIALAAEAAGSFEGADIKGQLRAVTSPGGVKVNTGVESIAEGLRLAAEGADIDYDGASSEIDWDQDGEMCTASMVVWQYSERAISQVKVENRKNPTCT